MHDSGAWVRAASSTSSRPEQGWKLHVSATARTALNVLETVLPSVLDEDVDFKVAASLKVLSDLNDGRGGSSQVGKFLTIYPADDDQAIRLAVALDAVTDGIRGPVIPYDRPLRHGSIVHYRYGGFGDLQAHTAVGEVFSALRTPEGALVPDARLTSDYAPQWAEDPFVRAGVAGELPDLPRVLNDNFVVVALLHRSPRSKVYLAIDVAGKRKCILKRVHDDGDTGIDRLRNEHAVLQSLCGDGRFPTPIGVFEHMGDWYLAMEDIGGQQLAETMLSLREKNLGLDTNDVLRWGLELADLLVAVHDRGYVYADLNPANVIVQPDGSLRLVDFELAISSLPSAASPGAWGAGTRGYLSPERSRACRPTVGDDVYSLGAMIYLLATGAEPSCEPDPATLLRRPMELANPAIDPAVAAIIRRCLAPEAQHRFGSAAACSAALQEAATRSDEPGRLEPEGARSAGLDTATALDLAWAIGDFLCDGVSVDGDSVELGWHLGTFGEKEPWAADLNLGAAGAALALSELVAAFGDARHRQTLRALATALPLLSRPAGPPLPGLYVGAAGVAAAQLRAGRVLDDDDLIGSARRLGRAIAHTPHTSPDLFNGSAGRLRFHLWTWKHTGRQEDLDFASAAAEYLLATADRQIDAAAWTIPLGYDGLSGKQFVGYAHGAAGIADTLLDLYEITNEPELLAVAVLVGNWLGSLARPALAAGDGLNWPYDANTRPLMAFWCHGAAGISRFLLHLHEVGDVPAAMEMAVGAARVVSRGTRWSGPTQCHGLAGNIECLIDVYCATGDSAFLDDAKDMAGLLPTFAMSRYGQPIFVTDHEKVGPGFTHGCAGVIAALLRLADPAARRHLLSVNGFVG